MKNLILTTAALLLAHFSPLIAKEEFTYDQKNNYLGSDIHTIEVNYPIGRMEIAKSLSDQIDIQFRNIIYADNQKKADDINKDLEYKSAQIGDRLTISISRKHGSPASREFWERVFNGRLENNQVLLKILIPDGKHIEINSASSDIKITDLNLSTNINSASSDINLEGVHGDFSCDLASGDIIITAQEGEITIETSSSDLRLNDIMGNVKATAASGDIEIDKVKGEVEIDCSSGDITTYAIDGDIDLSTVSGDIMVDDITGSVFIKSISGDISLKSLQTSTGQLKVTSVSGEISMELDSGFSGEYKISSISGNISHWFSGDNLQKTKNRISGKLGDGKGMLDISSTSGDITISEFK